jgi:hypothetical protein
MNKLMKFGKYGYYQYNVHWMTFLRANPKATKAQILEEAKELMSLYK